MRKCIIGQPLVNIGPFSATETSVLVEILYGLLSDFSTVANIFEYKFIMFVNHFTSEHLLFLLHST